MISQHLSINLHSTMYLLNPNIPLVKCAENLRFTFHYVSIKSVTQNGDVTNTNRFTFHYVSIKSVIRFYNTSD